MRSELLVLALLACAPPDARVRDGRGDTDAPPIGLDTHDTGAQPTGDPEVDLRALAAERGLEPWGPVPIEDAALYALGAQLFVEPLLLGGVVVPELQACSSCHAALGPEGRDYALKDIGDEGIRYGRTMPTFTDVGRAGVSAWFWDAAVRVEDGRLRSPLEDLVPPDTDPLVVALMWGGAHVGTVFRANMPLQEVPPGSVFRPADIPEDIRERWAYSLERVLGVRAYRDALRRAFPEVPEGELSYLHLATALAAFVRPAFATEDTPWDRWLAGDAGAMSPAAKRGGVRFFELGCDGCHAGSGFSDQRAHALAVPQFAPGIGDDAPRDLGLEIHTRRREDRFAFLTPRLRNLRHTRPYMHDGAYGTLQEAILHHTDPLGRLGAYGQEDVPVCSQFLDETKTHLPQRPPLAYATPAAAVADMGPFVDPGLPQGVALTDADLQALVDFLEALNEPSHFGRVEQIRETGASGLYPWFF
ncbi:MAG: hypothetical protein H6732_17365 [Alphaproteobacteria bacterium]|nr:hypothetical protein [Alphaproteobacteria bacterium]